MSLNILLADDSMSAQNTGRQILTEAGYNVFLVSNGAAAIKKAAEVRPDILLLDVYMPGYTGLEVCKRLKSAPATQRIPVLITVGKLETLRWAEAAQAGADGLIVKPFEAGNLLKAIEAAAQQIGALAPVEFAGCELPVEQEAASCELRVEQEAASCELRVECSADAPQGEFQGHPGVPWVASSPARAVSCGPPACPGLSIENEVTSPPEQVASCELRVESSVDGWQLAAPTASCEPAPACPALGVEKQVARPPELATHNSQPATYSPLTTQAQPVPKRRLVIVTDSELADEKKETSEPPGSRHAGEQAEEPFSDLFPMPGDFERDLALNPFAPLEDAETGFLAPHIPPLGGTFLPLISKTDQDAERSPERTDFEGTARERESKAGTDTPATPYIHRFRIQPQLGSEDAELSPGDRRLAEILNQEIADRFQRDCPSEPLSGQAGELADKIVDSVIKRMRSELKDEVNRLLRESGISEQEHRKA